MNEHQQQSALNRLEDKYLEPPEDEPEEMEFEDPEDYHEEIMLRKFEREHEEGKRTCLR